MTHMFHAGVKWNMHICLLNSHGQKMLNSKSGDQDSFAPGESLSEHDLLLPLWPHFPMMM